MRTNPFDRTLKVPRGFTTSPLYFVREEVLGLTLDPDSTGRAVAGAGLFHVTTNLPAVLAEGRLRSRRELQAANVASAGLGGGVANEAADKVSVGVTRDGALRVLKAVQLMADAVHGKIDSERALVAMNEVLEPSLHILNYAAEWMEEGELDSREYGAASDYVERQYELAQAVADAVPGPSLYNALQDYEGLITETIVDWVREMYVELDEAQCALPVGFTEPSHKFARVQPENVGLLQLAARKTARPEDVPGECELRFNSDDLVIVGVWQATQNKGKR